MTTAWPLQPLRRCHLGLAQGAAVPSVSPTRFAAPVCPCNRRQILRRHFRELRSRKFYPKSLKSRPKGRSISNLGSSTVGGVQLPNGPPVDFDDERSVAPNSLILGNAAAERLEGSTFNGREPGENRAEIRAPEFDSFSGRVSVNPGAELSLQTSYGYIHSPEAEHPEHDVWRTTASAVWVHPLSVGRSVDATLVWGRNRSDLRGL